MKAVGGNRGYIGYSMSKRAAEARSEGRYPKTDFKWYYDMPQKTLDMLVLARLIDDSEWHHTSKFGNKTTFYGWSEPEYQEFYENNKKLVDDICKGRFEGKSFIQKNCKEPRIDEFEISREGMSQYHRAHDAWFLVNFDNEKAIKEKLQEIFDY